MTKERCEDTKESRGMTKRGCGVTIEELAGTKNVNNDSFNSRYAF
ncbi:hypothetical protein [Pontibacillus salipaludis]|uniref:Uncharacterized protein n=1 Tax=Pontibacillus salipaludis TaxID=1697394 RepID=A0ABQ1Q3G1_9BACI|nr:hypothetical protein [Pontibacillus salipaludis]GGD12097.1 hypothetical protein GCM10011389_19530 [Pontibacillus salipaludis]